MEKKQKKLLSFTFHNYVPNIKASDWNVQRFKGWILLQGTVFKLLYTPRPQTPKTLAPKEGCYLICLSHCFFEDFSSPPSKQQCMTHFADYRAFSFAAISLFSFSVFSPLLLQGIVCHFTKKVLLTVCGILVWMHGGLAGHFNLLWSLDHGEMCSTAVNTCHLCCQCGA